MNVSKDSKMSHQAERVWMKNISKSFSETRVLTDATIALMPGEVRALVGENGAGKSTLMNILGGVLPKDEGSGDIFIDGEKVVLTSPKDAIRAGVGFVHQELSMFQHLSVAHNIFVDNLPVTKSKTIDKRKLNANAAEVLEKFKLKIPTETKISKLTIANQQLVEIMRAISLNAKLIIFDEPTSSLSEAEVELLFKIIQNLKEQGISIIYITHKLGEIFRICDTVTVLRDGFIVADFLASETTEQELVSNMVGREVTTYYPEKSSRFGEDEILRVENFKRQSNDEPISFSLAKNEILGFYGLIGAGRSELLRSICGIDGKEQGTVYMEDEKLTIKSYQDALRHGIAYLTEDRKASGLFANLSVTKNIYVTDMCKQNEVFLSISNEKKKAAESVKENAIKVSNLDNAISSLSGGNQQKVMLARCLRVEPKLIILDEPTRGIDVNAKAEIHKKIRKLAEQGMGVIVISSEMPEIIGLSDEIIVMREGRVTGKLSGEDVVEKNIIMYATEVFH